MEFVKPSARTCLKYLYVGNQFLNKLVNELFYNFQV